MAVLTRGHKPIFFPSAAALVLFVMSVRESVVGSFVESVVSCPVPHPRMGKAQNIQDWYKYQYNILVKVCIWVIV